MHHFPTWQDALPCAMRSSSLLRSRLPSYCFPPGEYEQIVAIATWKLLVRNPCASPAAVAIRARGALLDYMRTVKLFGSRRNQQERQGLDSMAELSFCPVGRMDETIDAKRTMNNITLTPRQESVLVSLASGKTMACVAKSLRVSEGRVSQLVSEIVVEANNQVQENT